MADFHFPSLPVYTPDPSGGTIDTLRQNLSGGQAYATPTSTTPLPLTSEDGGQLTSIRTDSSGQSTPFITTAPEVYIRFGTGPAVYMYTNSLTPAQVEQARAAAVAAASSASAAVGQATTAQQAASQAAFAAEASRLAAVAAAGGNTGTTPVGSGTSGPHTHLVSEISNMTAIGSTLARAANAAIARDAIGAGTSNVTVGGLPSGAAAPAGSVVDLTSTQTVGGRKTFTVPPVVPADSFPMTAVVGLESAIAGAGTGTSTGTPSALAALKADVYKQIRRTGVNFDGPWPPASVAAGYLGAEWIGVAPDPTDMRPGDIRTEPV